MEELNQIITELRYFFLAPRNIFGGMNIYNTIAVIGMSIWLIKWMCKKLKLHKSDTTEHPTLKVVPKEKKWYPTGWTWNEEKQLWEAPDYLNNEPPKEKRPGP